MIKFYLKRAQDSEMLELWQDGYKKGHKNFMAIVHSDFIWHNNDMRDMIEDGETLTLHADIPPETRLEEVCSHCLHRNIGGAQCCPEWDGTTVIKELNNG